jgi:hypothetical protein
MAVLSTGRYTLERGYKFDEAWAEGTLRRLGLPTCPHTGFEIGADARADPVAHVNRLVQQGQRA